MITPLEIMAVAGNPITEGGGGGGGLGNRVNATMIGTVLASDLAATKAAISGAVASHGIGRILNVTV